MIEKTGVGKDLLARFRSLKTHEDFISSEEMKSIEEKLKYWPNIYNEFVRCYNIFTKVAPEIYQKIDALKNYKGGIPALEFCFLVGCVREKGRMKLDAAVNNVLYGAGKNLLPSFN